MTECPTQYLTNQSTNWMVRCSPSPQMCYSILLNNPLRELYDTASSYGSNAV